MSTDLNTVNVPIIVRVPEGVDLSAGAVLRVRVEEGDVADRPPLEITRDDVRVRSLPTNNLLAAIVAVSAERIATRPYNVFVHFDVGGTGEIKVGDSVSAKAYPIRSETPTRYLEIDLVAVG